MAPKTADPQAAPAAPAAAPKMVGLPVLVATPVDVGRLLRELEAIDNVLLQLQLRKGTDKPELPKTSQLMDQLVELNKLNLLVVDDRKRLNAFLASVQAKAPVLHISFSVDPQTAFIEKLMAWLRREVHPLVLITVGLQPNIGAGCIVRSVNKYFDFSLRQDFTNKHDLLREKLALPKDKPTQPIASPVATQPAAQGVTA